MSSTDPNRGTGRFVYDAIGAAEQFVLYQLEEFERRSVHATGAEVDELCAEIRAAARTWDALPLRTKGLREAIEVWKTTAAVRDRRARPALKLVQA